MAMCELLINTKHEAINKDLDPNSVSCPFLNTGECKGAYNETGCFLIQDDITRRLNGNNKKTFYVYQKGETVLPTQTEKFEKKSQRLSSLNQG